MCQEHKRTFGIELEGYTNSKLIGRWKSGWSFVEDGSLREGDDDECNYCDGRGTVNSDCDHCHNGNNDCNDCDGSGTISCSDCDGEGNNECSDCDGLGEVDDEECTTCDGNGRVICSNCDDSGEIECDECNGSGNIECSFCDGEGTQEDECSDCNGSGSYDNEFGVECVSDICHEGNYTPIDEIFDYIEGYKWESNSRSDCGTHVHIGANDLTAQELSRLTILMNIVEPVIYGTLTNDRYSGSYSQPINKSMVEHLIELGETVTTSQIGTAYYGYTIDPDDLEKYDDARYYGLNLHSYFYRGTVEFRYFEGTDSREQAKGLVELCIKLVDFAKYTSFEQLTYIAQELYSLDSLRLSLEKVNTLLDLNYELSGGNANNYRKSMSRVATQLRRTTQITEAV